MHFLMPRLRGCFGLLQRQRQCARQLLRVLSGGQDNRSEFVVHVGFKERRVLDLFYAGAVMEQAQGRFILDAQDDQKVGLLSPCAGEFRVIEMVLSDCVRGLSSLKTGREIATGDAVQLIRGTVDS